MKDRQLGTLVNEDGNLAYEYAACKDGKTSVVFLYEETRRKILEFKSKIEEEIRERTKGK